MNEDIALIKAGLGLGVSTERKLPFFMEDLQHLLSAYQLRLSHHPFDASPSPVYVVGDGKDFTDAALLPLPKSK